MGRVIEAGSVSTADFTEAGYIDTGVVEPVTYIEYDDQGRESSKILPTGAIIETIYDKYVENNRILSKNTVQSYDDTNNLLNETRKASTLVIKFMALAFLIVGPTTTLPALMAVWGIARRRVVLMYISYSLFGAIIFGFMYQFLN